MQNISVFLNEDRIKDLNLTKDEESSQFLPLSVVHPDVYLARIRKMSSLKGSWRLFRRAIKNWIKKKLKGDN